MLRVGGGFYKGRVLKSASGSAIRPTMARIKLCLFDILQDQVREKIVLDGFAGTGGLGIEALSRGAEYVLFVDELPAACALIRHNLEKIGVPRERYRIVRGDFNRTVIALAKSGMRFDIVYLDPPYELLAYADPLKVIRRRGLLAPGGQIVLERPASTAFSSGHFRLLRSHRVGREHLDFYVD
jgi:16S rRNA (guanine(966)-N(2))-methyltransferase RsmD